MKRRIEIIQLILALLLVTSAARSQEKKVNIVPFPVIATNPTVGFAFGFSPGLTWYMGDKENTSMSSVVTSLVYKY